MRAVICIPTLSRPYAATLQSLEASVPLLDAAGIEHAAVFEVGCQFVSQARSNLVMRARKEGADAVIFIDHDVSWAPSDLLRLINTAGDVVAGTYRFKKAEVEYMGKVRSGAGGTPLVRADGAIMAELVPAGFLKVTKRAINTLISAHPELVYGPGGEYFDLFNHGAHEGLWWGEDYAFCRRWRALGEDIWLVPDLDVGHHSQSGVSYPGNFHEFMRRQPGGDKAETR